MYDKINIYWSTNQEHQRNDLLSSFFCTMQALLQEQQIEKQLQLQPPLQLLQWHCCQLQQ